MLDGRPQKRMSNFRRRILIAVATLISSCFGNGFWDNITAWSNNEGWVN